MATDTTPTAPAHLPAALQKKWSNNYADALEQAQIDIPNDPSAQRSAALREANKLLKVKMPEDHKGAAALVKAFQEKADAGWQILAHGTRQIKGVAHLSIVTADGQKGLFPIPAEK